MTLNLTPEWRIEEDDFNFILQHKRTPHKGKHAATARWFDCGYFTTLESALLGALNSMTPKKGASNPTELLKAIAEAKEEIVHACRQVV